MIGQSCHPDFISHWTGLVQMAKQKVSEIACASVRPGFSPQIRNVTFVVGPALLDFYTVSKCCKLM